MECWCFLRNVEARIRLMNSSGRHELPEDETEIRKLAFLMRYPDTSALVEETKRICQENRQRFDRFFEKKD